MKMREVIFKDYFQNSQKDKPKSKNTNARLISWCIDYMD